MVTRFIFSALASTVLSTSLHAQTTINVPSDYPTIQQGIDASANGDTVLVAAGTYLEQIDFGPHQITVMSAEGPDITIIDANYVGPSVTFGAVSTRQAVLQGFTITHGMGNTTSAGGIRVMQGSPTIRGNIIKDNFGQGFGNGISLESSSALVVGNLVTNNHNRGNAFGGGGGGGIGVGGDPCGGAGCGAEIVDNIITANTVNNFNTGGGIYINAGGYVKIIGNTITDNSALNQGGGIGMINSVNAQIENNLIARNDTGKGGGVYWLVPSGSRGPFLIGNTIVNNYAASGSAVFADGFDSASRIINNLLIAWPGQDALVCGTFDNFPPIVMANDAYTSGGSGGLAYAGLCAPVAGMNGNISALPIFRTGGYALARNSPGVDAGMNSAATQSFDLSGNPRIVDGDFNGIATIDMGAYELNDTIFANGFEP